MKKTEKAVAALYILLVYLGLATDRQHLYPVTYASQYFFGIGVILLCLLLILAKCRGKIRVKREERTLVLLLVIPAVALFLYSLTVFPLASASSFLFDGSFSRAAGLCLYSVLAVSEGYLVYRYFGKKAIEYTFIAVMLSYLTSIVVALLTGGVSEFVQMLTNTSFSGSVLEMHEVAPIAALFAAYYWFCFRTRRISWKSMLLHECVCLLIIILSMKRIVLLTVMLTFLLFEFLYMRKKQSRVASYEVTVIGLLLVIIAMFFAGMIRTGGLYRFLDLFHINSMARADFWKGIEKTYTFSPFYFGYGNGFVSKWMDHNWMNLGILGLNSSTGIHSDILKFYIDLGFIGAASYFAYLLLGMTSYLRTHTRSSGYILYFILMTQQFLIWFTDNISTYYNYQWIFALFVFELAVVLEPSWEIVTDH